MKKTLKKIVLCSLIVFTFSAIFTVAGCKDKKTITTAFVDKGEVGEYYNSALADGASLSLNKNAFTFTANGETLKGLYTFKDEKLVLIFEGDASVVEVTLATNTLTFTYKGVSYTLYRKVNYTVSFDGTSVSAQQVQNGQKAVKPADPTKEGYTFVGWYKENTFTNNFDFESEIITSDVTIYPYFLVNTSADDEFNVSFVSNVENVSFNDVKTFHKTVYSLPTVAKAGSVFAGWWVSEYEDATKLSYKYEAGMLLAENTVLYAVFKEDAPLVSVVGNNISWDNKGVGKSYNVKVYKEGEDTPTYEKSLSLNYDTYDFTKASAGNYYVEVSCSGATGKAYFINKGLATVSNFKYDGFTLTWNKVENATDYALLIKSGEQTDTIKLGDANSYNFYSIAMTKSGIDFTVVASANNYVSSTSKAFNITKTLSNIASVEYVKSTQKLAWNAVEGATYYKVIINSETYNVTTTDVNVDSYYGNISYSVTPIKEGYYSETTSGTYNKIDLATPKNIAAYGNDITWDEVNGAVSYVAVINGKTYEVVNAKVTLSDSDMEGKNAFIITVKAIAENEENNSFVSEQITLRTDGVQQISYTNQTISWNSVFGTNKYSVKIDNGEEIIVQGSNKLIKTLQAGNHNIYVAAIYDENPEQKYYFSYNVDVYTLTYVTNGGSEIAPYYYVAGDNVPTLPGTLHTGYSFNGWYVSEEAAKAAGEKFNKTTFSAGDTTIYAGWVGNSYSASLNYTELGIPEDASKYVVFGSEYTLPVPKCASSLKVFYGWYSEENNQGIRYTDQNGASRVAWRDAKNMTLYAGWIDVFTFELSADNTSYIVSAGEGAQYLTEVTIPATYDKNGNYPVKTIEAYAFKDFSNLRKIYIPTSITIIETGSQGPNGTGCAFRGCDNLIGVYMYDANGVNAEDVVYYSVNGSLVYKNSITTEVELVWVPYGTAKGMYTIPSDVTSIPLYTFYGCSGITGLTVPASVTVINDYGFAGLNNVTEVVFLQVEEGEEQSLALGKDILQYNTTIQYLNLPKRVDNFSAATLNSNSALLNVNFVGEFENAKYKSVDGVVYSADGKTLIYFPRAREDEFVVPTGVETIGESAFETCRYIKKVTIPGHVTLIDKYAFRLASRLGAVEFLGTADDPRLTICEQAFYNAGNYTSTFTELVLPENLIAIEKNAFGSMSNITRVKLNSVDENINFASAAFGSTGANPTFKITYLYIGKDVNSFNVSGVFGSTVLETVEVHENNQHFTVVSNVLYNHDITAILYYPNVLVGEFTLPETITSIGDRVFEQKTGMTGITIRNNVTTIGSYAFYNCFNLASITFEAGGTEPLTIGDYAFGKCESLETVSLSERTTTIGNNVFNSCLSLKTVNVPQNATLAISLDDNRITRVTAFVNCPKLENINVDTNNVKYTSTNGVLCEYIYEGETPTEFVKVLVCPEGKKGTLELPNTVKQIESRAFYKQNGLTALTYEAGLTSLTINTKAFESAATLESIELPSGLTTINQYSFFACTALKSVTIPKTVTSIYSDAFSGCSNIEIATFEEGRTANLTIEDARFKGEGENLNESEEVSALMDPFSIFNGCNKITTLTLPEKTVKIGVSAFAGMDGLTTVNLPSTLTELGDYAFALCDNLETVTFAEGTNLTTFGIGVFRGRYSFAPTKLKNINLPGGSYTIGDGAFKYTSLESIIIPEGVTGIGKRSFYGSRLLTTVSLPSTLTYINSNAFSNCKSLKTVSFANNAQLTQIGGNAFSYTALESIEFPYATKEIGEESFYNCTSLASITFATVEGKTKVSKIGTRAFANTAITTFTFPESVDDDNNPITVTLGGSVTIQTSSGGDKDKDKEKEKGKEEEKPTGDVVLDSFIFEGCKNLTTVTLSNSVTSVDKLFVNCPSLTSVTITTGNANLSHDANNPIILNVEGTAIRNVYGKLVGEFTIPSGITEISPYAFAGQTELTKIIIPNSVYEIGEYAFQNCFNLVTVEFETGSILTEIKDCMFKECYSLTTINLPVSVTKLGNYVFAGCKALTTLPLTSSVNTIGNYTFANCGFTELTIPASITTFGSYTFANNEKLTKVTLANGVEGCGTYMFANCKVLTDVNLSNTLVYLSLGMFKGDTALETITIPESVYRLGGDGTTANNKAFEGRVFEGCTNLSTINLNNVLLSVGSYTFSECTSITNFEFPETVNNLGEYLFKDCTGLVSCTLPSAIAYIPQYMFINCTSLKSIAIPETVVNIGGSISNSAGSQVTGYVFDGCTALESVTIPESVKSIGSYAFHNCDSLKEVTLPSQLTRLAANVFFECDKLETVTFTQKTTLSTFGNYIFKSCPSLTTVTNLPTNGSGSIGFGTFTYDVSLKNIIIPATCRQFSNEMFMGCTSLEEVDLSACTKLTALGSYVFQDCINLKTVLLPDSINTINYHTFMNTPSLKNLNTPASLTTISGKAFYNSGIEKFHIGANVNLSSDGGCFNNCPNLELTIDDANTKVSLIDNMFIVRSATSAGKTTYTLLSVINASGEIRLPENVAIGTYALMGLEGVTKITVPSTTVSVGNYAFYQFSGKEVVFEDGNYTFSGSIFDSSSVETVTLPSYIYSQSEKVFFPGNMFLNCKSLKSIVIPENVEEINDGAFQGCTALESVTLNEGLKVICNKAFLDCASLKQIIIPSTVEEIQDYVFSNTGLTSIIIPETVKTLGVIYEQTEDEYNKHGFVFAECKDLVSVTFEGVAISAKHTFENCTALETVTFTKTVTLINGYTFNGCTSLKTFNFNEGLQSIGAYAFQNTGLTSITLPSTLTKLCDGAFANCADLETVVFGNNLKYIGSEFVTSNDTTSNNGGVFENCTKLSSVTLPNKLFAINGRSFANCTALTEIVVGDSVSYIGNGAFAGWTETQTVKSTQSLYEITGMWEYNTTDTELSAYNANSKATFVFDYEEAE